MDASHVYVRALALGCFYGHYQYPNLSEGADRVAGQLRGDKKCPLSGVTKSGRVWRKEPESNGRSVFPVQILLRCLYSPRVQSYATYLCARYKSQALEAIPLFAHTKILYSLVGTGSAALAAPVPYPGMAARISHEGQLSTNT